MIISNIKAILTQTVYINSLQVCIILRILNTFREKFHIESEVGFERYIVLRFIEWIKAEKLQFWIKSLDFKKNQLIELKFFKMKFWGCRGTLNLFCVHLRRPCPKSWGICVSRVFNCLTIYDELNCIGLQVYAIYMPYKSYSANLESRDGSWIIIMTLGKDNSVLTYFCTFAI